MDTKEDKKAARPPSLIFWGAAALTAGVAVFVWITSPGEGAALIITAFGGIILALLKIAFQVSNVNDAVNHTHGKEGREGMRIYDHALAISETMHHVRDDINTVGKKVDSVVEWKRGHERKHEFLEGQISEIHAAICAKKDGD